MDYNLKVKATARSLAACALHQNTSNFSVYNNYYVSS